MCNYIILLIILHSYWISDAEASATCPCGYGGLCLSADVLRAMGFTSCQNMCQMVSSDFYLTCDLILDKCFKNPCMNGGTCVQTFGSFYCQCRLGFFGQTCEFQTSKYDVPAFVSQRSSDVYLYYQVHPMPYGNPKFTVIFDLGNTRETMKTFRGYYKVGVIIDDGRQYFPRQAGAGFKLKDVYNECLTDADKYPNLLDRRVCALVPSGRVWAFTFDHSTSLGLRLAKDKKRLNWRKGRVQITLEWIESKQALTVYNSTFNVITYFHEQRTSCLMDFAFDGCSSRFHFPTMQASGVPTRIRVSSKRINCKGPIAIGGSWYVQEIGEGRLPSSIRPYYYPNYDTLEIPSNYLTKGLYMFQFSYEMKGDPPFFGGSTTIEKSAYCWIAIHMGEIDVGFAGGDIRSVSCFRPAVIQLRNRNPSISFNDMNLFITCNHTNDLECSRKPLLVETFTKKSTPCNVGYKFVVELYHSITETRKVVTGEIRFVESETNFQLECWYNCYPLNPSVKVIWIAIMTPYKENKVGWDVKRSGEILQIDSRETINSFLPWTATRIFRIKGNIFENHEAAPTITFKAQYKDKYAVGLDQSDNIKVKLSDFKLIEDTEQSGNYTYVRRDAEKTNFAFDHITYRIYEVDPATKGVALLLETNYEEQLSFSPTFSLVSLCVSDMWRTEKCSDLTEVTPASITPSIREDELNTLIQYGEQREFLIEAAINVMEILQEDSKKSTKPLREKREVLLTWRKMPLEKRTHLLKLLSQVNVGKVQEADVATYLHILSMLFYSPLGNAEENLAPFAHITDVLSDPKTAIAWLKTRSQALLLLKRITDYFAKSGFTSYRQLITFPFGNVLSKFGETLCLARYQGYVSPNSGKIKKLVYRDYLTAEIQVHRWRNKIIMRDIMSSIMTSFSKLSFSHYGIITVGGNTMKIWCAMDTYIGLRHALNSTGNEALSDDSEYYFVPVSENQQWLRKIKILLPPSASGLEAAELIFVACIAKPKPGRNAPSPSLLLILMTRFQDHIKFLPGELSYQLILPKMAGGKMARLPSGKFNGTLVRPKNPRMKYRYFSSYKMTFPTTYFNWKLEIFLSDPTPIKVTVNYKGDVTHKDVELAAELKVVWNKEIGSYSCIHQLPQENGIVPQVIYLGILPSHKLPIGKKLNFFIFNTVDMCLTQDYEIEDSIDKCRGLSTFHGETMVNCFCKRIGFITTESRQISISSHLMEPINIVYVPALFFAHYLAIIILAIISGLSLLGAILADRKRGLENSLIPVEDTYPNETHPIIVGVCTGMFVGAGTSASVAIKIHGTNGHSKVHLLKTAKRKTLQVGADDWFVIATGAYVGTIYRIDIWYNFRNITDWYCDRLVIFDAIGYHWYEVNVKRWFNLSPHGESSRISSFPAEDVVPSSSSMANKFTTHYFVELRNTHHSLSMFTLHPRSLYSYEERTMIFLAKLFSLCFWTWIVLQRLPHILTEESQGDSRPITVVMETIILCLILCFLSTLTVWPFELLYKTGHLSTLLQRKTTNPYQMETAMEFGRLDRKSRIQSRAMSRVRQSTFTLSHKPSFRKASKDKFRAYLKRCRDLVFGPSQFLRINDSRKLLAYKMSFRVTIVRTIGVTMLVVLYCAIAIALLYTEFKMKTKSAALMVILSLAVDAICFNPFIILVTSFLAFFLFKLFNKEVYLINEDVRINPPSSLQYEEYLTRATEQDYKPLLTSEVKMLQKKQWLKDAIIHGAYFFCVASVAFLCAFYLFYGDEKLLIYDIVSLREEMSGRYQVDEVKVVSPAITEVRTYESARQYVSRNWIHLHGTWYSQKPISNDQSYWGRDHVSKPLGATSVAVLMMKPSGSPRVTKMFEPYFDEAVGYLSSGEQMKKRVMMAGYLLTYSHISSRYFRGKSGERYNMEGHNVTVSSQDYTKYYATFRLLMDDVVSKYSELHVRGLIVSSNVVNIFSGHIATQDMILEFLPSGIIMASFQIRAAFALSFRQLLLRTFIIPCGIVIVVIWLIRFVRKEISSITEFQNILQLGLIVALFSITLSLFINVQKMETIFQELAHYPVEEYYDIHALHTSRLEDLALLSLFLLTLLINLAAHIHSIIGMKFSQNYFHRCIRITATMFVAVIYCTFIIHDDLSSKRTNHVLSLMFTYILKEHDYNQASHRSDDKYLVTSFIFVICLKMLSGIIIAKSLHRRQRKIVLDHSIAQEMKEEGYDPSKQSSMSKSKSSTPAPEFPHPPPERRMKTLSRPNATLDQKFRLLWST